ncbi:hypothetical protein [Nonomuraea zeae]|uniref:Uncharacterized protein n=1 Tax=Nonomuraea zeae TaxID=1642303 RepID=A0A5S4GAG4_9ACTN|nr:hypothetical protein [Nonomuraea zeae]TMR30005.1 hypothetical protein ETD85_30395 [Nonomuraea zeae]
MAFTTTVRWRRRGEKGHPLLRGAVQVEVRALAPAELAGWADPAAGRPCPAAGAASEVAASFTVPDTAAGLRLTFTVRLRAAGQDEEALSVVQRLTVARPGVLVPDAYQLDRFAVQLRRRGGGGEVLQEVPSTQPAGLRRFFGRHPLLRMAAGDTPEIDTEFLDATNLWWALHFRVCQNNREDGFNPWYLEPACNDRPGRLRVLLNTRVTPMLWFASLPPELDLPDETSVGGYVFFRPIASAYAYPSTWPDVLSAPVHATTGLRNLCRYVLRGHTRTGKTKITGLPDWHQLLDHSPDAGHPLNGYAFLPCGMEHALDRTAPRLVSDTRSLRVLLLPVPEKNSPVFRYGGNAGPGNTARLAAAIRLLWTRGGFGGPGQQLLEAGEIAPPQPPQPGLAAPAKGTLRVARDVWAGAYSSAGDALWALLDDPGNRAGVARALVFDTVRFDDPGQARLLATAKARAAGRGPGLQVRIVWSPSAMRHAPTPEFLGALRGHGAQPVVWPKAGDSYFRAPPNPANPWAEYVFADAKPWTAAQFPPDKLVDWWHQFAVFAGEEIHGDPRDPGSISFMEATMAP